MVRSGKSAKGVVSAPRTVMLIGEYRHVLDDKRRIALPVKFRKALGRNLVMTHGLDGCLFVFSRDEWRRVVGKLEQLSMGQADSRAFGRFLFSGAADLEVDALGRVLIPEYLASHAHLTSRAVLIGVNDRVELWNEDAWDTYHNAVANRADAVAEKLGEVGVL